jgi:hypothetical protein
MVSPPDSLVLATWQAGGRVLPCCPLLKQVLLVGIEQACALGSNNFRESWSYDRAMVGDPAAYAVWQ